MLISPEGIWTKAGNAIAFEAYLDEDGKLLSEEALLDGPKGLPLRFYLRGSETVLALDLTTNLALSIYSTPEHRKWPRTMNVFALDFGSEAAEVLCELVRSTMGRCDEDTRPADAPFSVLRAVDTSLVEAQVEQHGVVPNNPTLDEMLENGWGRVVEEGEE